jgi:hypothetical protein
MLTQTTDLEAVEAELRRHQKTPQEVARMGANVKPFSYAEWQKQARPATPEELADWEEFLRERDAEREASLAREAGLEPGP